MERSEVDGDAAGDRRAALLLLRPLLVLLGEGAADSAGECVRDCTRDMARDWECVRVASGRMLHRKGEFSGDGAKLKHSTVLRTMQLALETGNKGAGQRRE
jgi:hypothetical protein